MRSWHRSSHIQSGKQCSYASTRSSSPLALRYCAHPASQRPRHKLPTVPNTAAVLQAPRTVTATSKMDGGVVGPRGSVIKLVARDLKWNLPRKPMPSHCK